MRSLPAPWQDHKVLGVHRFESTPFHWNGELYLLENFCDYDPADFAPDAYPPHTLKDGFIIRRVRDDAVIGDVVSGNYFASACVVGSKICAFASSTADKMSSIIRYVSEDLVHWSGPETIFRADPACKIFNTSIVWDGGKFVGVYETDTPEKPKKYIFKFWESSDLKHFKIIDDAVYGMNKYVGANSLYHCEGYYYLLYLEDKLDGTYETRIARSKDLKSWQDSHIPVMTPDFTREINPRCPGRMELNASDLELIEDRGTVIAFWNGGDQHGCADMQCARFNGSKAELFRFYFSK